MKKSYQTNKKKYSIQKKTKIKMKEILVKNE